MFDELHLYYNRELEYLRKAASEFAAQHPKIAGRLRLSADTTDDPHVERLLQGFAFIAARIHRKLDDDFPELTQGLLEVLYPHYLAPIPSMAIVQFAAAQDLAAPIEIPPHSLIEAGSVQGESCRYRTGYGVTLWPLAIETASLAPRPIIAPPNPNAVGAGGVLRLGLRCTADGMAISELAPDRLRLFIQPQSPHAFKLYELILNHTISVALADSPQDRDPVILGPDAIQPVGFGEDEWLLPYPPSSFVGYRVLTEYFAFPEKHLFFDIVGLNAKTLLSLQGGFEIFLYLNRSNVEIERTLSPQSFSLGCTPIVNLFPLRAEPIALDHRTAEYRVVPDARRANSTEIYAIRSVASSAPDGAALTYEPFFGPSRARRATGAAYWHASRRVAIADTGTDLFLSLVNLEFDPSAPDEHVLSVETLCLNRNLPSRLPFGGGNPRLELIEGSSAVERITCLTAPTPTLRPPLGRGTRWRLLSHLVLNHLSVTGDEDGADALRMILGLYDFRDAAQTRAMIDSVERISSRPGIARVTAAGVIGFCRGIDVSVEFAPDPVDSGQVFLLASVIDRFLGLYTTINSFTRMTALIQGRADPVRTWPARAGYRVLL
ncbi:MAG TPA: type VI secretion system baseplate subunit TssF [Stellaceae bacterium]|jgi:type VI secretion system protein ImpG|nr:type VI secretion system baseplate subunit TssF [Stellaceae bacterium]